jgi:zinc/manganese transport system substrate-binding protein
MIRPFPILLVLLFAGASAQAAPLSVVAAEGVYGDLAQQIGGDRVAVVSILNNPAQDPHLFEAGASAARALAGARLVVYNGAGYDPWMPKLLAVTSGGSRATIVAADILHIATGDNPHLWYDPAAVRIVAAAIAESLADGDPAAADAYKAALKEFDQSMDPLIDKIAAMRGKYAGLSVTATEPVFDYMARALGLGMRNAAFQLAVMNDTEPSARDVAAFEDDLKGHKVRALLYNIQSAGAAAQHMRGIAEAAHVPVVGVSETEPPDMHYQDWMMAELDALDAALSGATP